MGWEKGGVGGESWCFTVHRSEDRKVCVGRGGTGERERETHARGGGVERGGRETHREWRDETVERERETQREVRKSLGCH